MDEDYNGFNESTESSQASSRQADHAGQNPYGQGQNDPNQSGQQGPCGPGPYAQDPCGPNRPYGQNPYGQQGPYGPNPYAQYQDLRPVAHHAVSSFVLGILSVVFSGCPVVGLVLGIIGLVLANRGMNECSYAPQQFRNYGMLKAGRILSVIGLSISALMMLCTFVILLLCGIIGCTALSCCAIWPWLF